MKKALFLLIFICLSLSVLGDELYRIRVENSQNGLVQVSLDGGDSYYATGLVIHPANRSSQGFMASGYINGGCVCATASHAIRVKISPKEKYNDDFKNVKIFSLVAKEFWTDPKGFGGYSAPNSGMLTDIHTAMGIFSNFAPFPDSVVYEEIKGKIFPIESDHEVKEGNVYVFIANRPETEDTWAEFENIPGGKVTVNNTELTNVFKAFQACGRYDGTTFNSPGQINTAHGGVLTIATSRLFSYNTKEGDKPETRGGFMIQPVHHAMRQGENKPQVMTIGKDPAKTEQEGSAPLYSNNINLWYYINHLENSYYAELKVDDRYIPMPEMTGKTDNAFTKEYLNSHGIKCQKGVTGVRIHIPKFSRELSEKYLAYLTEEFDKTHRQLYAPAEEIYTPSLNLPPDFTSINFYVDGKFAGMTESCENIHIETGRFAKGLHHLQITGNYKEDKFITFSDYFYTK